MTDRSGATAARTRRWLDRRDSRRDAAVVALWAGALTWAYLVVVVVGPRYANGWLGLDAAAYYSAWSHDLYSPAGPGVRRFLYSPLFAQVVWPLTQLPWPVFLTLWTTACAVVFWWLLRPLPRVWRIPLFLLLCLDELILGNVRAFLALALVLSARRPGWWATMLLTKPATGIGALYYPLRRDWRSFVTAVAWTAGLAAVSFVAAPSLWAAWIDYLRSGQVEATGGTTLFLGRLLVAGVLVVVGARRGRYWWVVPAVALASPVINPTAELSLLTAIPRLWRREPDVTSPVPPTARQPA